jgi:hypothetical protein
MPPPSVVLHALHGNNGHHHRVHEDAMYVHDVHEDVLNSFTDPIETMKMSSSADSSAASAASASGTIAHMGSIGSVKDFKTFNRSRTVRESLLPSPPTFVPPKTEESQDSMNAKFGSVLRGVQSNQMDKLRRMHDVSRFTDPVHRHGQVGVSREGVLLMCLLWLLWRGNKRTKTNASLII